MAKARRYANPRRLTPSSEVYEQRLYDEAYGPRLFRRGTRLLREWEEDPALAAIDIRLSAPAQAAENVRYFNSLVDIAIGMGFTRKELRAALKEVDRITSQGEWVLPNTETAIDGLHRSAIREAREQFVDLLLDRMIEENEVAARDGVTPMW